MEKALFFRKCTNFKELKFNYKELNSFGQLLEYKIFKTIILSKSEYENFKNSFLNHSDIIEKYSKYLTMDNNDCIKCLLIKSNYDEGLLVYPAGYSYAKYVAFYIPNV